MTGVRPPRTPRPTPAPLADSPAIAALEADIRCTGAGAVRRFWERIGDAGSPMIEDAGGGEVIATFLWRGHPGTGAVLALVNKLTDRSDLAASLMRNVAGTDVWWLAYRLSSDWRGSYQFAVRDLPAAGGAAAGPALDAHAAQADLRFLAAQRPEPDPRNPRVLPQQGAAPPKSVAEMPAAPLQDRLVRRPGTPRGSVDVTRFDSRILGNRRRVWTYAPPRYGGGAAECPLLVLLDGDIWFETLSIAETLDELAARGQAPPMAAVGVDGIDAATRATELPCREPFARFVVDELLPWTRARLDAGGDPGRTVVAGQSLGGLAAGFLGLRAPERVGGVLMQSASLWWPGPGVDEETDSADDGTGSADGGTGSADGGTDYDAVSLADRYARAARTPLRLYIEVGSDEWVNLEPTRRFRDVLRGKGYRFTYREFSGGHDRACWRGGIADGLIALLGGG